MKFLVFVLLFAGLYFTDYSVAQQSRLQSECPEDKHRVREKVERFLFPVSGRDPSWANDAPGLAFMEGRHDVKVLEDAKVCERLNGIYKEYRTATSTFPDQKEPYRRYDVVYYTGANHYIVIISHAPVPQPDDPFQVAFSTGRDRIIVHDDELNEIYGRLH